MGGFVAALIALPYGLALASLMGLPPILGVYTSLVTAPILAVFGKNPVLIGGVSSVTVPFIAAAFHEQGLGGAAKVSIVSAVFMMIFCVMRLGQHVSRVPLPVVSGFSCGIGGLMILSQLNDIFGVKVAAGGPPLLQGARVLQAISETNWASLALGLIVIAAASVAARRSPLLPAPLIGVGMATLVARLSGWQGLQLGELSVTAPPFIGFSWTPEDVIHVVPEGFALAVVASVNLLVTSRVVEHFRGRRKRLKKASADAELGAYSMANLVAGVIGAPPAVGIPARSLANVRCGGMTRLSNLFHAAFLGGFLFLARDWIEAVPIPALAAVTAWMGICLLDWSAWRRLNLMRREDAFAFAGTALAVLLMNAVAAVALGYLVHAIGAWRTNDNRLEGHSNDAAERALASKG